MTDGNEKRKRQLAFEPQSSSLLKSAVNTMKLCQVDITSWNGL